MTLRPRGKIVLVTILLGAPIGVFGLTSAAPTPPAAASLPPLPRGEVKHGELAKTWTRKTAHVSALRVDMSALGSHTHGNWVFFRLPFDSTDTGRVRDVQLVPNAAVDPDVSAARVLGRCVTYKKFGPLSTWALYTVGAIGPSLALSDHVAPPTDDPTILALNVPTRVANYVSCGWENGAKIADAASWSVDISWEER